MQSETKDEELEIAHVLFIDIVGYSKLLTSEQRDRQQDLNRAVRETEQFREAEAANKIICIPTGDGMLLAFFTSPDAPARCAIAINRTLRGRADLPLRMGIHSGPVERVEDMNGKPNLAGAGVNIAQRVMDCGDSDHILLSARAADDLAQNALWAVQLHDLGEVEVKHGVRVRIASLYGNGFGNPALPQKVQRARAARRRRLVAIVSGIVGLLLITAASVLVYRHQLAARERAAAEAAAQRQKSVAVLPFENLTSDDKDAVFANGVHREVLSDLAKVADLKVISRTSVMKYKHEAERNVKQIANDLGVNYIVEGTVQRDAARVHVTVELIDTRTDTQAWAENYDGNIADVLSFQSEIAQRVTNQLGAKLSPRESNELAAQPTKDIAAFESYVRARALTESVSDSDDVAEHERFLQAQHQAIQLLEQALARDPHFLLAHCGVAEANIQLFYSEDPLGQARFRTAAEVAIKNAERIAPEAGETLYEKSHFIYYVNHDFHGALAMLERAAKVLPNNADVTMTRAFLYRRFGRWQEANAQFARTTELNPNYPDAYFLVAFTATGLRWWEDADRARARAVAKFPRIAEQAKMMRMMSLRLRGEIEAGNKVMDELHLTVKDGLGPLFNRAFWNRDYAECRRLLDEAATFPQLENERWEKQGRLVYVTKDFRSRPEALIAEKKLEAQLEAAADATSEAADLTLALVSVKYIAGKTSEALRLAEESSAKHPISEDALVYVDWIEMLERAYLFADEKEHAIETLAKCVQLPNIIYAYGRMKNDPVLDVLRSDPRFPELLEQSRQPFPRVAVQTN